MFLEKQFFFKFLCLNCINKNQMNIITSGGGGGVAVEGELGVFIF